MRDAIDSAAEILTLPEAAKFLRMSRSHLLNILKGKVRGVPALPYIRVGRRLLLRRAALEQWLLEAEAGSPGRRIAADRQTREVLTCSTDQEKTPETPERKPCVESDFSVAACER